jgi:hypothetical protein
MHEGGYTLHGRKFDIFIAINKSHLDDRANKKRNGPKKVQYLDEYYPRRR